MHPRHSPIVLEDRKREMLNEIIPAYMQPCDSENWSGRFGLACVNAPCSDVEEAWIRSLILQEWKLWIGRTMQGFDTYRTN